MLSDQPGAYRPSFNHGSGYTGLIGSSKAIKKTKKIIKDGSFHGPWSMARGEVDLSLIHAPYIALALLHKKMFVIVLIPHGSGWKISRPDGLIRG